MNQQQRNALIKDAISSLDDESFQSVEGFLFATKNINITKEEYIIIKRKLNVEHLAWEGYQQ